MTGRGIDQALPHPGDPRLGEPSVRSATEYVELAEAANGPIARPMGFAEIWGDALPALDRARPDVRIANLETSITQSLERAPKAINYRMAPANLPCIVAAGIDCCGLANNHVLDWGRSGLLETLDSLDGAGIGHAGAGRNVVEAAEPVVKAVPGKGRVLVLCYGCSSSGIPSDWAAGPDTPGVNLLPDLSERTLARIAGQVLPAKRRGDVVIASMHWGPNWGYEVAPQERRFAHSLIETAGVDLVHGHSSHHAKPMEVHEGKLILYGCGDFLNDYEGIGGYEAFRDDLCLMYLPELEPDGGRLASLAMVPFRIRNFRLNRAAPAEAAWLRDRLNRESARSGTRLRLQADGMLRLAWDESR